MVITLPKKPSSPPDRPRILINCAASLDGKIAFAEGAPANLSSKEDLARVHKLRNSVDAILVGVGTVLADDPSLAVKRGSVRGKHRTPLKIILDSSCRTPPDARVLGSPGKTLVVTAEECVSSVPDAEMLRCGSGKVDIGRLLSTLRARGIKRVLVEGGGNVIWSFLAAGLWDEMTIYYTPLVIGGTLSPTIADGPGATGPDGMVRVRTVSLRNHSAGLLVRFAPATGRSRKR